MVEIFSHCKCRLVKPQSKCSVLKGDSAPPDAHIWVGRLQSKLSRRTHYPPLSLISGWTAEKIQEALLELKPQWISQPGCVLLKFTHPACPQTDQILRVPLERKSLKTPDEGGISPLPFSFFVLYISPSTPRRKEKQLWKLFVLVILLFWDSPSYVFT